MLAEIGYFALWMSFLVALYAIIAGVYGGIFKHDGFVVSARNAVFVAFGLIAVSTGVLEYALISQDYHLTYVWSVTSPDMPTFFRVTALWGSQKGSLLFWSFLMSSFAALAVYWNWRSHRRLMPYAIAYMMATLVFFLGLSIFLENPFNRYWLEPVSGGDSTVIEAVLQPAGTVAPSVERLQQTARGLNPLLRHFGMAIHPPMLYLGFVGFIIPFAFAMAALASGDLSSHWIKASRRWTLVSWLFLGLGLILGGGWAYDVLGWGGYWGWDPVENAAFLPWLMGTAFLHSVMIQEKRGMLKTWNMFLAIFTFSAVIFGTFATRSGLVESVHSFARSGIGLPMFVFWFSLTFISTALILWRRSQGKLQDEHAFVNIMSRETLFVVNNIIFVALFVIVFWGSFGAPIISELFLNTQVTYGPEWFNFTTPPIFAAMYILMGIAPLSAWGATSIKRLGKSMIIPLALSILNVGVFAYMGMTGFALVGYAIVLIAGYVAVYETYRGFSARQKTQNENPLQSLIALYQRNPSRYGGYLVHLGVTVIGLGILGSTVFQKETQQTLQIGQSAFIDGYELRYESMEAGLISRDGRLMDIANITVLRDDRVLSTIRPRRDFYTTSQQSMTIAGKQHSLENDVYVILVGWEEISQNRATFKVYINPLINFIWLGSIILIIGTFASAFPHPSPVSARDKSKRVQSSGALKGAAS